MAPSSVNRRDVKWEGLRAAPSPAALPREMGAQQTATKFASNIRMALPLSPLALDPTGVCARCIALLGPSLVLPECQTEKRATKVATPLSKVDRP